MAILFLALALVYAACVPIFEGFDVHAHFAAIEYYRSHDAFPPIEAATVPISHELILQPPLYYLLTKAATAGWPLGAPGELARATANPYFSKMLAHRQSITVPEMPFARLAPAWIARFVSILAGLVTVLCTWWLARRLFPAWPTFAVAATAVAGFNPQFLFMSISISNDAWSVATCALALAVGIDVYVAKRRPWAWVWVGAAVGLAGLAKYSGLLVAVPLGILWLLYLRAAGGRRALVALAAAVAGFVLVAGWWFGRNRLLYGEWVPFAAMSTVLPTLYRLEPLSLAATLRFVPWLVASYWGVFVALIAPPRYLDVTRWLMTIGWLGLVPAAVLWLRRWRTPLSPGYPLLFLVLLPWLGLIAVSVLNWTRTVDYGEQGRLAHIGAAAFGVVMAAGWQAWVPQRWRPAVHLLLAGVMVGLAAWLVPFLAASFGLPPAVPPTAAPDRPLDVRFAPGMQLVGVDFPDGAAIVAGRPLPVDLYLAADAPIADDYTLFLHLADADDRLLAQFDGVPAQRTHPTRQWVPGETFIDRHELVLKSAPEDGLATLSMGFYPVADRTARVAAVDAQGTPIGDRVILGKVRLQHAAPEAATGGGAPLARWAEGIALHQAEVLTATGGLPSGVRLTWAATETVHKEYTVFVQVLDAADRVLAQVDSAPQGGRHPTSTWHAGATIPDVMAWEGDVAAWARIIVGLYDERGVRLPLLSAEAPDNAYTLDRRD